MNEFKIKNGLIINDTQPITSITTNSGLTNDPYNLVTSSAIKSYVDSNNIVYGQNEQIIFNNNGTLSGSSNLTFNESLNVNGNICSSNGGISDIGGCYVNLVNSTGEPSIKGKLVTYNSQLTFSGEVRTIKNQSDGKILVGGTFLSDNSYNMINLTSSGYNYQNFISPFGQYDAYVNSISVQSNGKLLVTGDFNYLGQTRIIRLETGGTYDSSFTPNFYYVYSIGCLTLQTDGKILVGGEFIKPPWNYYYICRLDSGGTIDTSFNTNNGFDYYVDCITVQSNGKILTGGRFTSYSGKTENYIIRLDSGGTKDPTFITGDGFNNWVKCITLQPDGKILVGGYFTTYSGMTQNYITRLDSGGTIDPTFNSDIGFDGYVNCITLQPDGKILVGGYFTTYSGQSHNRIIRLDSGGTIDSTFNSGNGFDAWVNCITVEIDSKILVGGTFTVYSGKTQNNIIRLESNGIKDSSFSYVEPFSFKYFQVGSNLLTTPYIGITMESGIEDGKYCPVVISGVADVLVCSSSSSISIGDPIASFVGVNSGELGLGGWDGGVHYMVARALESGNSSDIIKCLVLPNDVQGIAGMY